MDAFGVIDLLQARVIGGYQQLVVELLVDCPLDRLFDLAEIKHHALVVQIAVEFDVRLPAFPDQAAGGTQVRTIDYRQPVYEEYGHVSRITGNRPVSRLAGFQPAQGRGKK